MAISGYKKTRSGGNTRNMNINYQPQKEAKKVFTTFNVVSSDSPNSSQIGMRANTSNVG